MIKNSKNHFQFTTQNFWKYCPRNRIYRIKKRQPTQTNRWFCRNLLTAGLARIPCWALVWICRYSVRLVNTHSSVGDLQNISDVYQHVDNYLETLRGMEEAAENNLNKSLNHQIIYRDSLLQLQCRLNWASLSIGRNFHINDSNKFGHTKVVGSSGMRNWWPYYSGQSVLRKGVAE